MGRPGPRKRSGMVKTGWKQVEPSAERVILEASVEQVAETPVGQLQDLVSKTALSSLGSLGWMRRGTRALANLSTCGVKRFSREPAQIGLFFKRVRRSWFHSAISVGGSSSSRGSSLVLTASGLDFAGGSALRAACAACETMMTPRSLRRQGGVKVANVQGMAQLWERLLRYPN